MKQTLDNISIPLSNTRTMKIISKSSMNINLNNHSNNYIQLYKNFYDRIIYDSIQDDNKYIDYWQMKMSSITRYYIRTNEISSDLTTVAIIGYRRNIGSLKALTDIISFKNQKKVSNYHINSNNSDYHIKNILKIDIRTNLI